MHFPKTKSKKFL